MMFDALTRRSTDQSFAARWTTALVSGAVHVAAVIAIALPALYATGNLPEPRDAMAVFIAMPAAPPPPPPPAPVAAPPPPTRRAVARTAQPVVAAPRPVAAAPIEAPDVIAPETGLEGMPTQATIAAGFEIDTLGGIPGGVVGGLDSFVPPPPPRPPAAPVRVGGAIKEPRLLHRVNPEYPLIAQRAMVQGIVILEATVGRDGKVDEVKVLRSQKLLDEAAIAAVEQWIYEPLMLNGAPEPFVLTVTLSFSVS